MKTTLLLLPLLAAPAWGQAEDIYKSLALGDRVQITFRSGGQITGQLVVNPVGRAARPKAEAPEEKIDYSKADSVTVDLSWEYPGLEGTMSILKREIREVKKLQSLDKETMDRLRKQKEEIKKDLERQNAANRADSEKRAKEAETERAKLAAKARAEAELGGKTSEVTAKLKELEEGLKVLMEFPPESGWGDEKLKEIGGKSQRKQPITEQERRFLEVYPLWAKAKGAQDEVNKAKKEK